MYYLFQRWLPHKILTINIFNLNKNIHIFIVLKILYKLFYRLNKISLFYKLHVRGHFFHFTLSLQYKYIFFFFLSFFCKFLFFIFFIFIPLKIIFFRLWSCSTIVEGLNNHFISLELLNVGLLLA